MRSLAVGDGSYPSRLLATEIFNPFEIMTTEQNPSLQRQVDAAAKYCERAEHEARLHGGLQLLAALGIALAAGAIFYALRPEPPPRERLARLVADMEKRLLGAGRPALRKAHEIASGSAHAVADGMQSSEARVEHFLRDAGRRVRAIWA